MTAFYCSKWHVQSYQFIKYRSLCNHFIYIMVMLLY